MLKTYDVDKDNTRESSKTDVRFNLCIRIGIDGRKIVGAKTEIPNRCNALRTALRVVITYISSLFRCKQMNNKRLDEHSM